MRRGWFMANQYRHIIVERHGNVACVRLIHSRMNEPQVYEMFGEILRMALEEGCPRVALSLGPKAPECLYSVFIAKLIGLRRRLQEAGGGLKLCDCGEQVLGVLDVCVVRDHFEIVPDAATALKEWGV